jgi:guanosine-3',5'-bis(diphosphate) 3'-pyrophosphohydrolase
MTDTAVLLKAVRFAAWKHRDQERKGVDASPYINHPVEVADLLADVGGVTELSTLVAAVLHDTIEDTDTSAEEIERLFGAGVCGLVEELTDDKSLPKEVRKQLQIDHARDLSPAAKEIKLADKISNVGDVTLNPPEGWSLARREEYLDWAEKVIAGCRGVNTLLDREFDRVLAEGRKELLTSASREH